MKILLWAPFGAGEHYWGPGTSAFRLYRNACNRNIEVTLAHGSSSQSAYPKVFKKQVMISNLENKGFRSTLLFSIRANQWLNDHFHEFDIFHGISAFDFTFRAALQMSRLGKPTFIKITGLSGGFGNNSLLSRITGIAQKRKNNANEITGYLAISNGIYENLINNGICDNKIHKIPNGVDTSIYFPVTHQQKIHIREELGIPNRFTFIYVGGVCDGKRVMESVQATSKLIKEGFDIQLLVVGPDRSGDGLRDRLMMYVKNNNLSNNIIFINHTLHPAQFYQASDLFLLPSKSEGMPNALLEAMACGLPSIVTEIPGCIDLVKDQVHGLYTSGEISDIVLKMKQLLKEKGDRIDYGKKAAELTQNTYSASYVLGQHMELFSRHLKKPSHK